MQRCPLQGEPVAASPGRGMAARGQRRTEVTLQLGQHLGQELLTSRLLKPSLPAPPELLQPSQGNAFAFCSVPLSADLHPLGFVAQSVFKGFTLTHLNLAGACLSFKQQI